MTAVEFLTILLGAELVAMILVALWLWKIITQLVGARGQFSKGATASTRPSYVARCGHLVVGNDPYDLAVNDAAHLAACPRAQSGAGAQ